MSFVSNVSTIVFAILLESLPYVLLGVLISGFIQTLVTDEMLQRWIPKHPLLGILFGCFLGIVFPLCECGIIPVVQRLIRKGMPPYIGIVFLIAGPVINPIVLISTFEAFRTQPDMAIARAALTFITAAIIGLWAFRAVQTSALRNVVHDSAKHHEHDHTHEHHNYSTHAHTHGHHSHSTHAHPQRKRRDDRSLKKKQPSVYKPQTSSVVWLTKVHDALEHAAIELFDVGKFIVLGATCTALLQTLVNRNMLLTLSHGEWAPHLFMMGLSYVLSICSTADSFVGATFLPSFSLGSVLAFLVFGAMLDLKSTLMLLKVFRFKTVASILLISAVIVLLGSVAFDHLNLNL